MTTIPDSTSLSTSSHESDTQKQEGDTQYPVSSKTAPGGHSEAYTGLSMGTVHLSEWTGCPKRRSKRKKGLALSGEGSGERGRTRLLSVPLPGLDLIESCWAAAERESKPACRCRSPRDRQRILLAWFRHMAVAMRGQPIGLAVRAAAAMLGVGRRAAHEDLLALEESGDLIRHSTGDYGSRNSSTFIVAGVVPATRVDVPLVAAA